MRRFPAIPLGLLLSAGACVWVTPTLAFDFKLLTDPATEDALPAVSSPNGKWEFYPGMMSPGGMAFRAAGSLTVPLGQRFGAQADVMATTVGGDMIFGAAGHLFTRDPSQYLLGVTPAVVISEDARMGVLGLEAELYADRVSVEAWGGLAAVDYVNPADPDEVGFFGMVDFAYYPLDDLRLAIGARTVLGDTSLHLGGEYLLSDMGMPVSLAGDALFHTTGEYSVMFGVKGYLGPTGEQKSLIDRHRQDDPRNRALDLFYASLGIVLGTTDGPEDDPEYVMCVEDEGSGYHGSVLPGPWNPDGLLGEWVWNSGTDDCEFEFDGGS